MTTEQQTQAVEDDHAAGWRPNPGDRVQGIVTSVVGVDMGYGTYPVVTIKQADESEVAVHAFHTVLRRELAGIRPEPGDDLDITYLGKKTEGGSFGKGYDNYRVRSSKQPNNYDWDRELSDDQRAERREQEAEVPIQRADPPAPDFDPAETAAPDDDLPF